MGGKWCRQFEKQSDSTLKGYNIELPYNQVIPQLCLYLREIKKYMPTQKPVIKSSEQPYSK